MSLANTGFGGIFGVKNLKVQLIDKISVVLLERLNLNLTYQQKYVLYATALLTGEKNGLTVGMKSNIVLKDVGEIGHLRR